MRLFLFIFPLPPNLYWVVDYFLVYPVVPEVSLSDIFRKNVNLIKEANPDAVIVNTPGVLPGTAWFGQKGQLSFRLGVNLVSELMDYEYSIYEPGEFWRKLNYTLNDLAVRPLLPEMGKLNRAVVALGIKRLY